MCDELPLLYVEDDPDDVHCLKSAMLEAKCTSPLVLMPTGEGAKDYLEHLLKEGAVKPSLILVDMVLPGISGFELIAWIKTKPHLKHIPIIALSGTYRFEDLEAGYVSGANLYLIKPASFYGWTEMVKKLQGYWSIKA